MSILDILLKAGAAGPALVKLLEKVREAMPDLAPEIDKILVELAAAVSPRIWSRWPRRCRGSWRTSRRDRSTRAATRAT